MTSNPPSDRECLTADWTNQMRGFGERAAMIRRILDRFHNEDVATRRYLRRYLDEEWANLQRTYETLREEFASSSAN